MRRITLSGRSLHCDGCRKIYRAAQGTDPEIARASHERWHVERGDKYEPSTDVRNEWDAHYALVRGRA